MLRKHSYSPPYPLLLSILFSSSLGMAFCRLVTPARRPKSILTSLRYVSPLPFCYSGSATVFFPVLPPLFSPLINSPLVVCLGFHVVYKLVFFSRSSGIQARFSCKRVFPPFFFSLRGAPTDAFSQSPPKNPESGRAPSLPEIPHLT